MNAVDRRARRGQRARAAGDPADVQRLRPVRLRRRLPPGHRPRLGRAAGRARDRRGHQHVRPRHRRRRRRPPVRPRGGPGGARPGRRGARLRARRRAIRRSSTERRSRTRSPTAITVTPTPATAPSLIGDAALGRDHPSALPGAGGRVVHRGAAGLPAAPRRHPRRPACRADPAARRRRPGAPGAAAGRAGPVGDQHDDDAPEQLDARRLLRVLLPHRHRAPHPRGPQHVRVPAPARSRRRAGGRPAGRGARGDRRRARAGRPRAGRPGRRRAARGERTRWRSSPSAVDLLTDTLLSHLSYEERELLHPLAQHGLG